MGWNQLNIRAESDLLDGLDERSYAYFVHSFYCAPSNHETVIGSVDYGIEFAAIVQRDNIYGVQFHPEKAKALACAFCQISCAYRSGYADISGD